MNAAAIVPGPDGVRPPNGTRVVHTRHASQGGQAYPKEMREQVLEYYLHGGWMRDAGATAVNVQFKGNELVPPPIAKSLGMHTQQATQQQQ